jgi:hypothetical protein
MKNILLIILVLIVMAPQLAVAAPQPELWPRWQTYDANSRVTIDHSAWSHFLSRYLVTDHPSGINRVRYVSVTPDDKKALQNYLDRMQATPVSTLNRLEQKAYWLNLNREGCNETVFQNRQTASHDRRPRRPGPAVAAAQIPSSL